MAKVKLTKKEADKLMLIKGNIREAVFKAFYPYIREYMKEFILKTTELIIKPSNKAKIEQTKSLFNNDPYDEFKITW